MYADLPNDVPMSGVPPEYLVDDKRLADIEVHPGDEFLSSDFLSRPKLREGFLSFALVT
jgi:hypothetical protein